MKLITSRDNPFFRRLIKLEDSPRQRRTTGLTLLDGIHLVNAHQLARGAPKSLIVSESGCEDAEIKRLLAEREPETDTNVVVLSDALFREISPVKTPTGIMALISIPSAEPLPMPKSGRDEGGDAFCVLLEAMQDPG
ncbi:MAG: RNA methyltransferase, partial [Nitrosospira sp.]|nr:RNA methyltransferase [Nitrosospira sp.]